MRRRIGGGLARGRTSLISPAVVVALVLALTVLLVLLLVRPNPSRPLRPVILTSSEWEPYVGPDLDGQGPLAQMVVQTLRAAGYSPQVEFTSWTAAQQRAGSGEALGTFPFVASSNRSEDFLVSDQIAEFTYVLFQHVDGPEIRQASDLANLRVAGISGYEYWPELDAVVDEYVEFATSGEALRALASGEVDVVVEGEAVGRAIITDEHFPHDAGLFTVLPKDEAWQFNIRGLHLLMPHSSANEDLMAAFNEQFAQYRHTDAHASLVAQLEEPHDEVVLASKAGSVWLHDAEGGRITRTPNGTTAAVLAWPESLGEEVTGAEWVHIRVTSGPFTGRHLYADLADMEVER